jgi:6-pyruvoyltetrahydropterin/6-carboxytetrahydropterin synthase
VLDKVDHKNLNLDVDFMKGKLTSVENLIMEIWKILDPKIKAKAYRQTGSLALLENQRNKQKLRRVLWRLE